MKNTMSVNKNTLLVILLCAAPLTVAWGADRLGFLDEPMEPRFQQSFDDQYDDEDDDWLFDDSYGFSEEEGGYQEPATPEQPTAVMTQEDLDDMDFMDDEDEEEMYFEDSDEMMAFEEMPAEEEDMLEEDTMFEEEDMADSEDMMFMDDMEDDEELFMDDEEFFMDDEDEFFMNDMADMDDDALYSDEPIMPATTPMAQAAEPKPSTEQIIEETSPKLETFSIDFPEEEIRNIIRNVADLYGLNVVIPDTLIGMTSITLNNVSWQQVYRAVLEPVGFTYVMDGNIIKIVSSAELETEQMETEIFPLRFAVSTEAATALGGMLDVTSGAKVAADARTNSLIVTERPSRMAKIEEIVKRLDREETQIMIESKFVEIKNKDTKTLGIDWNSLGASGSTFQLANSLTTAGAAQGVPARSFVKQEGGDTTVGQVASKRTDNVVFAAPDFQLVLHALEQDNDTRLIANPTVVTMNNTPAVVAIADQRPIPEYQYNGETGVYEISGFEYKDIGIILNVTPNAKQDLITLNIKPEISSSNSNTRFGAATSSSTIEIPNITSRRTESVVTIKSGYTLAIGGLVRSEYTNNDNRVPFLGYIPVIKRLFSYDNRILENKNIIAFVTATQIGYDGSMPEPITTPVKNVDERQIYEMGLSELEMYIKRPDATMEGQMQRIRQMRNATYGSEYSEAFSSDLDETKPDIKRRRSRRNRVGRQH